MDTMEQKTERAAFEAWAEKNWMYVDVKDNSWEVWRAAIAAERERGRKATQEYMRANPLGGPAKVFYACADAIRAGDPIDQAMANFGLAWAAPDSAAIRGN